MPEGTFFWKALLSCQLHPSGDLTSPSRGVERRVPEWRGRSRAASPLPGHRSTGHQGRACGTSI